MAHQEIVVRQSLSLEWYEWLLNLYFYFVRSVMYNWEPEDRRVLFPTSELVDFFNLHIPSHAEAIDRMTDGSGNDSFTARRCCHLIHMHCPDEFTDTYAKIRSNVHEYMEVFH